MGLSSRAAKISAAVVLLAGFVYLNNASWLAPAPQGKPTVIAHRGVYQTFDRTDLGRDDCTATRIFVPEHDYLENTLASMEAAFDYGADIVEIDIHPTVDGEIAVFHDWTIDCRTEGTGVTHKQTMEYLKTLDIGYGYTFDGGETFPFRGKGVGLMPTLEEVYRKFPGRDFLINIKSNNPEDADKLVAYLRQRKLETGPRLMAYGGERPIARLRELRPDAFLFTRASLKRCAVRYFLLGWSGYMPEDCRNGALMVPNTWQWAIWGWPNRFIQRVEKAGSLMGVLDYRGGKTGKPGIYRTEELGYLPEGYNGTLWVEKIEVIGPHLQSQK